MLRLVVVVTALATLIAATPGPGQTGHWVQQAHDIGGQYSTVHAAGDRAAVVTQEVSRRLLFFDTLGGQWVPCDLDADHHWQLVTAEGDLALAVADDLAVVFNALTSAVHVLELDAAILDPDDPYPSYGCGPWLAFVATEASFHVFDAELDAWQQRSISLPGGYSGCNTPLGDDHVGLMLYAGYSNPKPTYAYSLPQHSFAFTDDGPLVHATLDHGFTGSDGGDIGERLVGYSAITGTFSSTVIDDDHSDITIAESPHTGVAERTVYAAIYTVYSTPERQHHFHAFDTRQGSWEHDVVEYLPVDLSPTDLLWVGGQFAVTPDVLPNGVVRFRVYSGTTGHVRVYEPELGTTGLNIIPGGSTLTVFDLDWFAWGLNTATGDSSRVELENGFSPDLTIGGEHWGLFSLLPPDLEDPAVVITYDGLGNDWNSIEVNADYNVHSVGSPYCYVTPFITSDMDILLYSGHHNDLHRVTMPDGPYPYFGRSDNLIALHNHAGQGLVFDAERDVVYDRTLDFQRESVGQSVLVGADGATAWGYSALVGLWSSQPFAAAPEVGTSSHYLGWVADADPARHVSVFNAFHGAWSPLDLNRAAEGLSLGHRTMVVVTADDLYAYDPDGPITSLEDDDTPGRDLPELVGLAPAAPNPFNPSTTFAFNLPTAGHVALRVHDLRGRCVATLDPGELGPGRHTVSWHGRDDGGRALPSGTYVLRLETEQAVRTQKLMLVR